MMKILYIHKKIRDPVKPEIENSNTVYRLFDQKLIPKLLDLRVKFELQKRFKYFLS